MNTLFHVLFLCCASLALGQSSSTACIRSVYSWARYESTVERNPFVQKTLEVVPTTAGPLQDWALASIYGDKAKPTVVLINLKTGRRLKLTSAAASHEGLKLHHVVFGASRYDTYVDVVSGQQHGRLKWDAHVLQSLAASSPTQRGATGAASALPSSAPHLAAQAAPPSVTDQSQLGSSASSSELAQRSSSSVNPVLLAMGSAGGWGASSGAAPSSGAPVGQGPSAPASEYVNVPLEGGWAQPPRRALLRPTLFAGHPDPQ